MLSQKLREHRQRCGYSQRQASELLGVSQTAITRIENRFFYPSKTLLEKMLELYEVPPMTARRMREYWAKEKKADNLDTQRKKKNKQ